MKCIILLLMVFSISFSASFDCSKAVTDIDKCICQDTAISRLDNTMSLLFSDLKKTINKDDQLLLKTEQLLWISDIRNKKWQKSPKILKKLYENRINDLNAKIEIMKSKTFNYGTLIRVHPVSYYDGEKTINYNATDFLQIMTKSSKRNIHLFLQGNNGHERTTDSEIMKNGNTEFFRTSDDDSTVCPMQIVISNGSIILKRIQFGNCDMLSNSDLETNNVEFHLINNISETSLKDWGL